MPRKRKPKVFYEDTSTTMDWQRRAASREAKPPPPPKARKKANPAADRLRSKRNYLKKRLETLDATTKPRAQAKADQDLLKVRLAAVFARCTC